MWSSPLIPKDKVSSSTNGSINARRIASWVRPQQRRFLITGNAYLPSLFHTYRQTIVVSYSDRFSMVNMFLKNWNNINASVTPRTAISLITIIHFEVLAVSLPRSIASFNRKYINIPTMKNNTIFR